MDQPKSPVKRSRSRKNKRGATVAQQLTFRDRLDVYLQYLKRKLRLADWTISLSKDPCDPSAYADIGATEGRKVAELRICPEFESLSPEVRRQTLIHELIHAHMTGMNDALHDVEKQLQPAAFDVLMRSFMRQLEIATDGLADAIAPMLQTMEDLEEKGEEPEYAGSNQVAALLRDAA